MDNDQNIQSFCAATGATQEVAENYLKIADGNVETAVTLFWESDGQDPSSEASGLSGPSTSLQDANAAAPPMSDEELARQLQEQEERKKPSVRAPIAARRDILTGGGSVFGSSPVWGRINQQTSRPSVFNQGDSSSGSRGLDFTRTTSQTGASSSRSRSNGEMSDASSRAKRLADLFRPPFDIMYKGGFEDARAVAREQSKWVMVNIQDSTEFSCQVLNRDLWSDEIVKEVIRESFVFLQYTSDSPEGKRYLTYYNVSKYPHIAVIDSRTAERVKVWESQTTPSEFMMEVTEFLDKHSTETLQSATMKKPRVAKSFSDMSEEEQINAAIAASLNNQAAVDPEATRAVEPSSAYDKDEGPFAESEVENPEVVSVFDSIQAIKRPEPTDLANSTRIQLRMADGSRVIRRFLKSDPVRSLFEFVKAEVSETQQQPFELVFNRKQLIDILDQSLEEAGLLNAAVNFMYL